MIKRKKAYGRDDYEGVTPLEMVDGSKMSGEKPLLEVHYSQDKTQKL